MSARRRWAAVAAMAVAATGTAMGLATVVVHLIAGGANASASDYWAFNATVAVAFSLAGATIARRQPTNLIAWALLAGGLGNGIAGLGGQLGLATHSSLLYWFFDWTWITVPVGIVLVFQLFPTGRPAGPRWRVVGWLTLAAGFAWLVVGALQGPAPDDPNWYTGGPLTLPAGPLDHVVPLAVVLLGVIGSSSLVVRWRRGTRDERDQLKWLLLAAPAILLTFIGFPIGETGDVAISAIAVTLFVVPVSIAVVRHRLFDVDIVISRGLVYGSLAVLITGVYVGIAVGIGELVGSGGRPNLGLSILATAIVAVGFQPARERLQLVANRLVYGKRATPYQVLSEFSSHVAGSYSADEVLPRMARVLQEGTGAESATVWLSAGGELHVAASSPPTGDSNPKLTTLQGEMRAVEVRHQGELLGALSVVKRRGESLTPVEEKLLTDLGHQAGLVLKNVGLTADLQRRLEELRASRQRLVSAQDAERRRLERNLHDGAQQNLVALKVKLGLVEILAARDPEKAKQTLQQLKVDADEALETLRDLARGIYPPLLAEKGLVTALEAQARKAMLPVSVEAEGVDRYPQEVEATVYFCVLEALQNVQKYANATRARVRLHKNDAGLRFEVEDDGRGFDVEHAKKGSGLSNMQDRLDALGGAVTITSAAGAGTRLVGVLHAPAPMPA